jgi:hypothetical protein
LHPLLDFCLVHTLALVLDNLLAKTFLGLGRYFEKFQRDFVQAPTAGVVPSHFVTRIRNSAMVYTASLQRCSHSALICAAQRFSYFAQGG